MISRRQFIKQLGLGLFAGSMELPAPSGTLLAGPYQESPSRSLRIGLLADSHLPDANPGTSQARNLLVAVAEINAQTPPVDLVFLAGDLTDNGEEGSLHLGKEILATLKAPCWLVAGEHDVPATAAGFWQDAFGNGTFSFSCQGVHFCGLNTNAPSPVAGMAPFQLGPQQQRWLAGELAKISSEAPVVILSHAPLYRLYQPWQWWTADADLLHGLLHDRANIYLLHGHVHQNIGLRHRNLIFQGLRATAWPHPDVRVGSAGPLPAPGAGGQTGCGWMLLTVTGASSVRLEDQVWHI